MNQGGKSSFLKSMVLGAGLLLVSGVGRVNSVWGGPLLELEGGVLVGTPVDPLQGDRFQEKLYLLPKGEWESEAASGASWRLRGSLRGSLQKADARTLPWESRVEIRNLSASFSQGTLKTELGFQEVSWGETFGAQIADVVNPRDFSDPLLINDLSWVRLPVFALNTQLFLDRLTLQGILTPIPPGPSTAPELGGRAGYLFGSGFDLGVLYFHHADRNPIANFAEVDTFGLTSSQAIGKFIFRGDLVLNHGRSDEWLSVLGTDVTLENDVTLGGQLQTQALEGRFLKWTSFMVRSKFLDGKLEPELFIFYGLNNPDLWVQPKVNWNLTDVISVSLRADLVVTGNQPFDGALGMLKGSSRVLSWVSFRY